MNQRRSFKYEGTSLTTPVLAFAFVVVVARLLPDAAAGEREALERCRYLHDRIEHYTRLRRGGGNGAQMERWRTARQKYEREYRERRCYRFGSRLTIRP